LEIEQEYQELVSKSSVRELFRRRDVDTSELGLFVRDLLRISKRVALVGPAPDCRDEDDRKYLHCTLIGKALWLVTRDPDLLTLGTVGEAAIMTPEEFLAAAAQSGVTLDA
jgi:predicted nucleic acid-binding protein